MDEALQADVVVRVVAAVGRAQPEVLLAEAEVDDVLRTAVAGEEDVSLEPERAEDLEVERDRALDVADAEVDVLDRGRRHAAESTTPPARFNP